MDLFTYTFEFTGAYIHKRMLIQVPGQFLAVVDYVMSEKAHDYIQWFHIAPELELVIDELDNIVVLNEKENIHSTIHL